MIGNDIVDIEFAKNQSNWRRKGFMDKTFSKLEQAMILSSLQPDLIVWRLWSMKESVYKATRMLEQQILLNPLKFQCEMLSASLGKVIFDGKNYLTTTHYHKKYVLTESMGETYESILNKVIFVEKVQLSSAYLYKQLKSDLALINGWSTNQVAIIKNELGIPQVYHKMKKQEILVSLSHHGMFGAYLGCF